MLVLKNELTTLPPDRVRMELEAAFNKSINNQCRFLFFKTLNSVGASEHWFSELGAGETPIIVWKDHPHQKEMLYLSLAFSISTVSHSNTAMRKEIQKFCKRLQLGISSEMENFALLSRALDAIIRDSKDSDEELLMLCRGLMRGKLPSNCYFDGMREINEEMFSSKQVRTSLTMIEFLCLALKELKFSKTQTPTEIKETQLSCVREFVELYLGANNGR